MAKRKKAAWEMNEGIVEKLVFGGQGLLREADSRVIFLPYVLPQERVSYVVTRSHPRYAEGQVLTYLSHHPCHVAPPCQHARSCHGCPLQHTTASYQLELKHNWLVEFFSHHLKETTLPAIGTLRSCQPWGYRRTLDWQWESGQLGYRDDQGNLIPIENCLLINHGKELINLTREVLTRLELIKARVRIIANQPLPLLLLSSPKPISQACWLEALAYSQDKLQALIIDLPDRSKGPSLSWGMPFTYHPVMDLSIRWHVKSFMQNHHEAAQAFYQWLFDALPDGQGAPLTDLYCGVGITSLLAARKGYRVTGVELNPYALKDGADNARRAGVACSFLSGNLQRKLPEGLPTSQHWIVNPPKQGLTQQLLNHISMCADELYYLSCHPATLVRDLKLLVASGLKIKEVQPFDAFPQTTHLETIVHLSRKD